MPHRADNHPTPSESRRTTPRDSLFLTAQVRTQGLQQTVRLRNLSADGAMIEGQVNLHKGQRVAVHVRNKGWVEARVAWVRADRCGVTFAAAIDPRTARMPV